MYTIKEAAARTGLTVPVLRAWERRYGVVAPTRTAGGYRVYDEAALAAVAIDAAIGRRRLVAQCRGRRDHRGHESASRHPTDSMAERKPGPLVEQLVDAAAALDSPRIEAVLDEMFAGGTYERVVEDHVIPSLRALGDAWAAGRVPVAGEHVASNAVLRRLAASFQASGPGRDQRRPVLVGMPPGARHELGGLIFATALRRAGLPVVYLGADLPLDDWIAAVERTDARAVVIGAVMPADATGGDVGRGTACALGRPEVLIAFGGAAAPDPDAATASAGAIRLPGQIGEALAALSASLPDDRASPPGRSSSRRFPA